MKNQNNNLTSAGKKKISFRSPLITAIVAVVAIGGLLAYPVYRAYQSGKHDAQMQWQKGTPTIIYYVAGVDDDPAYFHEYKGNCYIDSETGLPLEIAQPEDMNLKLKAYVAGYNNTIKRLIAENGQPANSYKSWIDQIFHPADYFANSKIKPTQLSLGGPRQPFGKGSARLMKNSIQGQPAKLDVTIDGKLYLIPLDIMQNVPGNEKSEIGLELLPGPAGTAIIFIKSAAKDKTSYWIFDAKTGKCLYATLRNHMLG